jgi:hypothetical protein
VLPALLSGTLLGAGLALSDMINPGRVLAFLDIAGARDATLVFVIGGAVVTASIGYIVARRMHQPLFGSRFFIPENRALDTRLILRSMLFGIAGGWLACVWVPPSRHSCSGCGNPGSSSSRSSRAWRCIAFLRSGPSVHRTSVFARTADTRAGTRGPIRGSGQRVVAPPDSSYASAP